MRSNKNRMKGYSSRKIDNQIQAHHIIQNEWAKQNIRNYSQYKAPAILLPSNIYYHQIKVWNMQLLQEGKKLDTMLVESLFNMEQ